MTKTELAGLRRDYARQTLSESTVSPDPFEQFSLWMNEALDSQIIDATAMTLATVDENSRPAVRVVLLKGLGPAGFTFYTNYDSKKARDLAANPNAALHFFWAELERQVSINGSVEKTTREESEAYFSSRPVESRIAAWASKQSSVVASRTELEARVDELREQFGDDVPLPPFWGGFRLVPERFEFWQGRPSRLHDRIRYTLGENAWKITRLSP